MKQKMNSDYTKYTKEELLNVIEELEGEIITLNESLDKQESNTKFMLSIATQSINSYERMTGRLREALYRIK